MIPGVIGVGVLNASTEGGLLGSHQGFARSSADVADVVLGTLTIDAVHSECLSNGDGSSGLTRLVGVAGATGFPELPAPNSSVPAASLPPGVAEIVLNEQIIQNSTGGTSIIVNAIRITLLPNPLLGNAVLEVILAQSRCAAAGPNVNTGQVAVIKNAPADAQDVLFTFTITCPNTPGSPFTRTVLGSGTTDPVVHVPSGTVCTAAETTVPGFEPQDPRTFGAVASGATSTVTFTNTREPGPTGSVAVVKDAPADAQDVTFTFTITCPGAAGSPFTRTVTGDGTSAPVTGLTPGTVCSAAETTVPGFEPRPDQIFAPVVAGTTRTVTFVNTRVAGPATGSVAVVKDAPADAQDVTFTFTITCPGAAGSPFTRTVTGDGTSAAVTGLTPGTVCSVAEAPVAGFIAQANRNLPAVVANQTQTVTFVNSRTGDPTGSVAVVKQAPTDAQNVVFTFTITCPGAVGSPFTRSVTGTGTAGAVTGLAPGTVCTAAETPVAGFNNRPNQTFAAVTTGTTQTVTFVNTRSTVVGDPVITVIKSADPISRPEPGGTFTFTVRVTNHSSQPVVITSITDDVHGNLNGRGSCDTGESIAAGSTYACAFSVEFTGDSGDSETDRITVRVVDGGGRTGTDTSDGVTIRITDPGTPVGRGQVIIINNDNRVTATCNATSASAFRIAQINVENNNTAECVATSTSATTTSTATKPPVHQAAPTGRVLARTGTDSLALGAFAMLLLVAGFQMSSRLAGKRNEM